MTQYGPVRVTIGDACIPNWDHNALHVANGTNVKVAILNVSSPDWKF